MSDKIDYYDCLDTERLQHETMVDAIEALVDRHWPVPGQPCDVRALLDDLAPIAVTAYAHILVGPAWVERMAAHAADDLIDRAAVVADEEYGDPEGDADNAFADGAEDEARAALLPVMRTLLSRARVWRCEQVRVISVSAEEAEAMLRASCPWLWESSRT